MEAQNPETEPVPSPDLAHYYRNLLKPRRGEGAEGLESFGLESSGNGEADLSDPAIKERVDISRSELQRIIKEHLGDKQELHEIANQIATQGDEALRVLRDDDGERLANRSDLLGGLEAIVRTDGSRPSFMVRDGEADLTTSPVGDWEDFLTISQSLLRDTFDCIGRLDVPGSAQGFQGTGFLIHENLILTNRHVLQVVADWQSGSTWSIKPGAAIDFGHEFNARVSVNRRALKKVVFCGANPIVAPIDHKKLDVALIELEPADAASKPRLVLPVASSNTWAAQDAGTIYTVGYPGKPGPEVHPTLLEQLFQSTFGYKRIAPGIPIKSQRNVHTWTFTHDATTLGGNSGSAVLVAGHEQTAAAIHYGGRSASPKENWGHVLADVLDVTGGCDDKEKSLREHFNHYGVQLV